jgi:hypothetical protein
MADDLSKYGPPVPLNADGSVNCRKCGFTIVFPIPPLDELPDGAPRTVNHTGCSKANVNESPAGGDLQTGFHETRNVIDANEVLEFASDPKAFAEKKRAR